jgi:CheY-like chemotaxis protein
MGGEIGVQSELGRGSTFSFTARFDLISPHEEVSPPMDWDALRDLSVLIVDDNATNRKILQETLRHWQMACSVAASATDALALLRESQAGGKPFRLVLTDVNMPEVDGFVLCEQIRSIPDLAHLILVVLTSGDRAGDISRCQQLGVAAHLLKPVKPSELLSVLLRVLGNAVAEEDKAAGRPRSIAPNFSRPLRVLVAEDSLMNQTLAECLLTKWGHSVDIVENGLDAVEAWERRTYDLILMDVQMPGMSGLEATAVVRQREAATDRHIPIVAITARALEGDRDQCVAAGMDYFVSKPIRHLDLLQAIQACCPDAMADDPGLDRSN